MRNDDDICSRRLNLPNSLAQLAFRSPGNTCDSEVHQCRREQQKVFTKLRLGRLVAPLLLLAFILQASCIVRLTKLHVKRLSNESVNVTLGPSGDVNKVLKQDGSNQKDSISRSNKCFDPRALSKQRVPTVYLALPTSRDCASVKNVSLIDDTDSDVNRASLKGQLIDSKLYNATLESYFLVHGFLGGWRDRWICELRIKIMLDEPANIFLVDWTPSVGGMMLFDYSGAVTNANWVGQQLAKFVNLLVDVSGQQDSSNVHFVGFSLGAQISGFVGYSLKPRTLGRITGLDPAGPCFESESRNSGHDLQLARKNGFFAGSASSHRRLSQASAQQVVAIHTDTRKFGLSEPVGHVDVYLNGGEHQPGCGPATGWWSRITCSHSYAQTAISGWSLERASKRHRCYLVAFECSSWKAFKAGECGLCEESQCAKDIGVPARRQAEPGSARISKLNTFKGHYLLTSANRKFVCLFHYQFLVAIQQVAGLTELSKQQFELEIPPAQARPDRTRLVRVSHLIDNKSPNLVGLKHAFAELNPSVAGSSNASHFYSALITFKLDRGCTNTSARVGKPGRLTLCEPLQGITVVRLFAKSDRILNQVRWLAINYMSGSDSSSRQASSFVLVPKASFVCPSSINNANDASDANETAQTDEAPFSAWRDLWLVAGQDKAVV